MQIIPLNLDSVLLFLHNSKLAYSHAGLAPEASNIPNEIQVLNWGLIWSFPLFIRRTDYWNYYWNQICKNKLINPLVRGTLDFVLVQSSLPPRKAEHLIGLFMTAWHLCFRVGGFQNPGVCLQAFPSFPSIHRPVILCSRTAQKRLLCRLAFESSAVCYRNGKIMRQMLLQLRFI